MDLGRMQTYVSDWSRYNFGDQESWKPLMGVSEEVGELCHAHLKGAQGIRHSAQEVRAAKIDALGDIMIYLMDYADREGISLEECLNTAWKEVRGRDWVRLPGVGNPQKLLSKTVRVTMNDASSAIGRVVGVTMIPDKEGRSEEMHLTLDVDGVNCQIIGRHIAVVEIQ